jgi:osmoprotectant transport system substrate-binding protein
VGLVDRCNATSVTVLDAVRRLAGRAGRAGVTGGIALALVVTACGGGQRGESPAPAAGVRVASFNFPESRLLAEIYVQALEDEGVAVRRELDLGPRELVLPALRQDLVDVVPEYLGTALTAMEPGASLEGLGAEEVGRRLAATVEPWGLAVLRAADAQNQNGLAVTRATAERHRLAAVSDLVPLASGLVLGGPPECPQRRQCLRGLEEVYGLRFESFMPFESGDLVRRALEDEVVDVGVVFTTDGVLAGGDLVLLADDRGLQPVENVAPLVRREVLEGPDGRTVEASLVEVSDRLTTANLRFLNWRVTVAGNAPAHEARAWLIRQGLIER